MNKKLDALITGVNAEEMFGRIRAEAENQARETMVRAEKEAARVLAEASEEAQKDKDALFHEAEKASAKLKERIASTLHLEKKKVIMAEKERFVEAVLQAMKKNAEEFRASNEYPAFLKKAIAEGIGVVDDRSCKVLYSFLDEKIFTGGFQEAVQGMCRDKFKEDAAVEFIKADFKDIGVIIQSKDGRLNSDKRFLSLLKKIYDDVYMRLLKEAF